MRNAIRASLLKKMKAIPLVEDEGGHMEADELLLKAIEDYAEQLSALEQTPARQEQVKRQAKALIEAYRAIPKWYA